MAAARELPGDFIIGKSRQNQEDRFNKLVYPLLPPSMLYSKKDWLLMRDVNLLSSIITRVWKKYYPQPTICYHLEFKHSDCTIKHIAIITNVKYICIYDVCVCSFPAVPSPLALSPLPNRSPPDETGPFPGFLLLKGGFLCHRCWNKSVKCWSWL